MSEFSVTWWEAVDSRACPLCRRGKGIWCTAVINGVVTDRELVKPHDARLEGTE